MFSNKTNVIEVEKGSIWRLNSSEYEESGLMLRYNFVQFFLVVLNSSRVVPAFWKVKPFTEIMTDLKLLVCKY